MVEESPRRSIAERIRDVLALFAQEEDAWVASAGEDGAGYLIPLTFYWDGEALIFATPESSPTARNLHRTGRTRVGIGPTRNVVMVDGRVEVIPLADAPALAAAFAANTDFDPRAETPPYAMMRLIPETVQAWRTAAELRGRVVMRAGQWLAEPAGPAGQDLPAPSDSPEPAKA